MTRALREAYDRLEYEERRSQRWWRAALFVGVGAVSGIVGGAVTLVVMVFVFGMGS